MTGNRAGSRRLLILLTCQSAIAVGIDVVSVVSLIDKLGDRVERTVLHLGGDVLVVGHRHLDFVD